MIVIPEFFILTSVLDLPGFRTFYFCRRENMEETLYMEKALELAARGMGWTSPNPMVGALIVKNGKIIAEGWHHICGSLHAERDALKNCREDPSGSTMYVTLEPCCHWGKQPPCVEAIVEAGIARVVIGAMDPNPLVAGKGAEYLRQRGIAVTAGVLRERCEALNEVFLHYIQKKSPFVVMKYAMTMDGKIAACTGDSKWVTGPEARDHVQSLRGRYRAIMVGIGTVLADDPLLTARKEGCRNPIRIVCDSSLRTPLSSQLVKTAKEVPVVIATCRMDGHEPYEEMGCHVLVCAGEDGRVDLPALMEILGKNGVDSVLVEGGAALNWSVLQSGLVRKVYAYMAPKLIGGGTAKTPIAGEGFPLMAQAISLAQPKIRTLGEDILLESQVK